MLKVNLFLSLFAAASLLMSCNSVGGEKTITLTAAQVVL